jgi:hypothetical protein
LIGITNVEVTLQPFGFVTVTLRVTLLLAVAKVMLWVPAPAVMVALLAVHVYVAPGPAFGTEATFPVEFRQTVDGALIVAIGTGSTGTSTDPVEVQPDFVTVTLR